MAQATRAKAARKSGGGRLRGNAADRSMEHYLFRRAVAHPYGTPGECVLAGEAGTGVVLCGAGSRPGEDVVVQRWRVVL